MNNSFQIKIVITKVLFYIILLLSIYLMYNPVNFQIGNSKSKVEFVYQNF